MTTAVLPLTEDEERALRAHWEDSPTWAQEQIGRLLATLDAERATPRVVPCSDCEATGRMIVGIGGQRIAGDWACQGCAGTGQRVLPRPAPPHSRSDARRIAAQRGEPTVGAPTGDRFDVWINVHDGYCIPTGHVPHISEHVAMRERCEHPGCKPTHYVPASWLNAAPPYPASVVEAVRALDHASRTLAHDRECECLDPLAHVDSEGIRSALASLPKELRDAARER